MSAAISIFIAISPFMKSRFHDSRIPGDDDLAAQSGSELRWGRGGGLCCGADGSRRCADRPGDGSDNQWVNVGGVDAMIPGGQASDGVRQKHGVCRVYLVPVADGVGITLGQVEHAAGIASGHEGGEGGLEGQGEEGFSSGTVGVDATHSNTSLL